MFGPHLPNMVVNVVSNIRGVPNVAKTNPVGSSSILGHEQSVHFSQTNHQNSCKPQNKKHNFEL